MCSEVLNSEVAEGFDLIAAGLAKILAARVAPVDSRDAVTVLRELEQHGRCLDAARSVLLDEIDQRGLHAADGHRSAKVMVRHLGRLPNGEAAAREKAMKACRDLPDIFHAWALGEIGTAQVQLLARVHANARVRDAMDSRVGVWLEESERLPFKQFQARVLEWERLTDQDGPRPDDADRTHQDRDAKLIQNPFDLSWDLDGRFGSLQGCSMREVWDHYYDAETRADWEQARALFGDAACAADLARTDNQRRADALHRIFEDAAASDGSAVPPGWVHSIVWSQDTFEEMVARMDGQDPRPFDPDTFTCETPDGFRIDPNEGIMCALATRIRRIIIDAAGEVIDQGRARCFTGAARTAAKHGHHHCLWPGCGVPVSRCQVDHLTEHSRNGPTNPGNGAPLCGRHNRLKHTGYTIWRDPDGTWHILRPDGTTLPP